MGAATDLLQRRRQMMAKRGGPVSPYGDAVAAEIDFTVAGSMRVLFAYVQYLSKCMVDGEEIELTAYKYMDFDVGVHTIEWYFKDPTVIMNSTIGSTDNATLRNTAHGNVYIPACVTEIKKFGMRLSPIYLPTAVYIYAKQPPLAVDGSYNTGSNPTIHVPKGSGDAYKTDRFWGNYKTKIIDDL